MFSDRSASYGQRVVRHDGDDRPRAGQPTSTTPSVPPRSASNRLSVMSCANSRPRLAPIDARTASSRCRAVPRASSRLATFTQAISSTKPTTPSSSQSAVCVSRGRKLFLSGSTLALQPVFDLRIDFGDPLRHR